MFRSIQSEYYLDEGTFRAKTKSVWVEDDFLYAIYILRYRYRYPEVNGVCHMLKKVLSKKYQCYHETVEEL